MSCTSCNKLNTTIPLSFWFNNDPNLIKKKLCTKCRKDKRNDFSLNSLSFWFNLDQPIPVISIKIYIKEKIRGCDSLIDVLSDKTNFIYMINTFMNFRCINNSWRRYKHKLFIIKLFHKNKYKHVMREL